MQKLELYYPEKRVAELNFLSEYSDSILAYQKQKQVVDFQSPPSDKHEMVKIESYMKAIPQSLIKELSTLPVVTGLKISRTNEINLKNVALEQGKKALPLQTPTEVPEKEQPPQHKEIPSFKMDVQKIHNGNLRLTIVSDNKKHFLFKMFGVLAQNNIQVISGNTYPHGDVLTGSFVVNRINKEQIQYIQQQLSEAFSSTEMGNGGFKSFVRPELSDSNLELFFDEKGSLPSIKIVAVQNDFLLRYMVQEAFVTFDIEVTVARFGYRGKTIEDQYYIKLTNDSPVNLELVKQIEKYFSRR